MSKPPSLILSRIFVLTTGQPHLVWSESIDGEPVVLIGQTFRALDESEWLPIADLRQGSFFPVHSVPAQ